MSVKLVVAALSILAVMVTAKPANHSPNPIDLPPTVSAETEGSYPASPKVAWMATTELESTFSVFGMTLGAADMEIQTPELSSVRKD